MKLTLLFLAVFVMPSLAFANDPLTGEQIKNLLNDKTFNGHHEKSGWDMKIYANPNGEWTVNYLSGKKAGTTREMTWSVKGDVWTS